MLPAFKEFQVRLIHHVLHWKIFTYESAPGELNQTPLNRFVIGCSVECLNLLDGTQIDQYLGRFSGLHKYDVF